MVFADRLQGDGDQGHDRLHNTELQRGLGVGEGSEGRGFWRGSTLGSEGGQGGWKRHLPACRSAGTQWSRPRPEGSRCHRGSWTWVCKSRSRFRWTRPQAARCPGLEKRCLPDGLSSNLSHDGALAPQALEAEAQEAVNDEGCGARAVRWAGSLGTHTGTARMEAPPPRRLAYTEFLGFTEDKLRLR